MKILEIGTKVKVLQDCLILEARDKVAEITATVPISDGILYRLSIKTAEDNWVVVRDDEIEEVQ